MKITYTQYINNPLGEKSSVITNRGMYQKMYKDKLDKILLREGGKVEYKLYTDKDKYYIHFKIPSEVIEKFYYDTIIEFYTTDSLKERSPSLKDYNVRFYSNDPAFCYTFAHAFIKNDLFIKDLAPKMLKSSITTVAKEKNPKNLVGYVKSLFFAYLLIGSYSLFAKASYSKAEKYSARKILKEVEHAKDKIQKRQKAEEDLIRKKKRKENNENRFSSSSLMSNKTKPVTTSRITSNVSKSRVVRKTKRI